MLQIGSDNPNSSIALDNISNIERILGPYDCYDDLYKNGYSRYELDPYISIIEGERHLTHEGKFHCVTRLILFRIINAV